jgi:hypothetical protein
MRHNPKNESATFETSLANTNSDICLSKYHSDLLTFFLFEKDERKFLMQKIFLTINGEFKIEITRRECTIKHSSV